VINATGLTDVYPVPLGLEDQTMAGVAIHANIIETMVQQLYFREQSALSQVLLIFGLALIVTVLLTQLRWRAIIVLTPVLVVIWLVAALTYGNVYHVVMNLFDPMVAIALPLPAALAVNIYLETQRREWTEILLNSAVSASQHQLDLNSLYETIASDIQTLIPCEAVQIHTWNNLTNTTELVYQTPPEVSDISWAPGLIQQALKNKHLAARPEGVALPLFWQDKPQAVIFIYANEGMNETRRRILNLFAWQTSSILANAELYQQTQQLSELKTRMIRMASHDLKNPIGAVIGYTELLLEDQTYEPFLSEEQDRYLQAIMTSANQMERIVRDILNIERVRSGQIQNEPFSLLKVMENCLTVFKMEAERNQQKLHSELPKEFPMLMGDQGQLYEAVSNLVSNALKYTPPNGNITVELSKSDKFAKVMVADDGPGIPLQAQAQLFQEFYRVKTEATAHVSGTGLGLSLVKSVVEAHKGHVWVESDVGKGSKFFIELPLNEAIPIPVEA
jgi:signal transduction histidine kinase